LTPTLAVRVTASEIPPFGKSERTTKPSGATAKPTPVPNGSTLGRTTSRDADARR